MSLKKRSIAVTILIFILCVVMVAGIYILVKNNTKSKSAISENVDQNLIENFKNTETGASPTTLLYASQEYAIIYDRPGLLVYDLQKEKVIQTLNLASINMNDTQGDNFASIQISDNGDTIYLQNENAGLNYEYNVKNSKLTKVKKIDVDNISTFSNDIYYFSDKGTPDSKQLKSLLPLSEMIKIGPDKWVYLNKDKEDDTFSSLKIIVWTEKNVKEYPLFK